MRAVSRNKVSFVVSHKEDWYRQYFKDGGWEQRTFNIIKRFSDKKKIYLDIGSWIGPMALFASLIYKDVYAVEPDPTARESLLVNAELNNMENIKVCSCAISGATGKTKFGGNGDWGNSESTLLINEEEYLERDNGWHDREWRESDTMEVDTLDFKDYLIQQGINLNQVALIKMDIEGGEKYAMPSIVSALSLLKEKPPFFLSIHWPFLSREEVIKTLSLVFPLYSRCESCGRAVTWQEVIDDNGHNYGDLLFE